MGKIIEATPVYIQTTSENFWWAVHGLEASYEEDLFIHYRERGDAKTIPLDLVTKGYFQKLMSAREKVRVEDYAISFHQSIDDLLKNETIIYNGEAAVYHPSDSLSLPVAQASVQWYCKSVRGIHFPSVKFAGKPKRSKVLASYREAKREIGRMNQSKREGRFQVELSPAFLQDMFGIDAAEIDGGYINAQGHYVARNKEGVERVIPFQRVHKVE